MEPTKEEIEELKCIEIGMLQIFVDICDRLHLRYYLLGGTLLGAVRHQGFIPWDDDIDVGMPRADYEVFLKESQALLPDNMFLQTIFTDKEYLNCFAKIRNSDTTFMETSSSNRKINHGVFVDIFPLDYYPENEKKQKLIDRKKLWFSLRINQCFTTYHPKKLKTKIAGLVSRLAYPSVNKALVKRENMYKSIPQSNLIANYGGAWGKKEIVPADWYGEGTEVTFEGMKVMAPVEYDKWLTQVYGDYMQLPPVEKRVGHHYVEVIDLHKSYKEYMER